MTDHRHIWVVASQRDEAGVVIIPVPQPWLWECTLCDATHRGETAPDGTTFDEWSDAYHHHLDYAGL
jgi:hypothetical protein